MRNFNATTAVCLLAALLLGGNLFAQRVEVRGDYSSNLIEAQRVTPSYERQGINVIGPLYQSFGAVAGNCDTILTEDFQSGAIPASWVNIDVDGLMDANGRPQDWFILQDLNGPLLPNGDTNLVATASSWFTPAGVAANWLIMDPITVCDPAVVMQWQSAPFEGPGFMDGYALMASPTADTVPSAFTDTLARIAEDVAGGGGTAGPGWVHTNYAGNNGLLQTWIVGLGNYNNQTIRIGFFHDSDDDNLILIDNIFIGVIPGGDMAINTGDYGEYPIVPDEQVQAMTFTGNIENTGSSALSNAAFNVEVFNSGGTSVFTGSSSVTSLPAFTDTTLTVTGFTPAGIDIYDVLYTTNSGSPDPNALNDSLVSNFIVDDTVYARDGGNVTGALSIGGGAMGSPGFIGQEFDIVVADTMTAAGFFLTAPTIGDTIHAVVIPMGPLGPAGAPIATSEDLIVTAADTGGVFFELSFPGGVPLAAGTSYFLGLEETVMGALTLGTSSFNFTPGKGWVFFNGTWSNSEDFNFNVAYVLRGIFSTPTMISVDDQLSNEISVYPIPAEEYLNVEVVSGLHSDLNVQVIDLQGRVLNQQVLPSSSSKAQLYVGDLASGVYFVEVRGAEGKFVKRITVK